MCIIEIFPTGPFETNAIVFACEETKVAAVIDPGHGCSRDVIDFVDAGGFSLAYILLTHSHWDHIASVGMLKEYYSAAQVLVYEDDAPNLRTPGADGLLAIVDVTGVEPDGFLVDDQQILVGSITIEVLHTPGHSHGSVCFSCFAENILFSGDTLFRRGIGNLSFPTSDPEKMATSLLRLSSLPADTVVYPGHGDMTTIGEEIAILHAPLL